MSGLTKAPRRECEARRSSWESQKKVVICLQLNPHAIARPVTVARSIKAPLALLHLHAEQMNNKTVEILALMARGCGRDAVRIQTLSSLRLPCSFMWIRSTGISSLFLCRAISYERERISCTLKELHVESISIPLVSLSLVCGPARLP